LHIPADSPSLDLPRENAEIGGVDFMAESKFDKLAKEIAEEYREKGKSAKQAMKIGEATAAKIGRAKFGKKKFAKMGKSAESFSTDYEPDTYCDTGCGKKWACGQCERCGACCECLGEPFAADSTPLPPDPRVSPLNKGLYTPSDSPTMAAEKKVWDEGTPRSGPYVFPDRKAYPIGNETHGKLALIYSTWPKNKADAPEVRKKVFARYPELRDWFEDGKYEHRAESLAVQDVEVQHGTTIPDGSGQVMGQTTPTTNFTPFGVSAESFGAETFGAEGNSYTNYQPLPVWPPAARHIITGISKADREAYDEDRCGPVYWIDDRWEWCNGGSGWAGHLDSGSSRGPMCGWCGMNVETGSFAAESFEAETVQVYIDDYTEEETLDPTNAIEDIGPYTILKEHFGECHPDAASCCDECLRLNGFDVVSDEEWERIKDGKKAESPIPTRIEATQTQRGVVQAYDAIPAGDGHVVGQFTPDMDYAPSGMYAESHIADSIQHGFGAVLGVLGGLIVAGSAMNAVSRLSQREDN
jgi:hypothetical protein